MLHYFNTSNIFYTLKSKMGYQKGQGLGKYAQGIVKPVEESNQMGVRGLGYKDKNFQFVREWDYADDPAPATENPNWIENIENDVPSLNVLKNWKTIGKVK